MGRALRRRDGCPSDVEPNQVGTRPRDLVEPTRGRDIETGSETGSMRKRCVGGEGAYQGCADGRRAARLVPYTSPHSQVNLKSARDTGETGGGRALDAVVDAL